MVNTKPVSTPLTLHLNLSAKRSSSTETEFEATKNIPYASTVGCLMYVLVCTRPGLTQDLIVVYKYMSNLGSDHWQVVKWILKGTRNIGIMFEGQHRDVSITGCIDSDYARDLYKRQSTTRCIFTCSVGPISWRFMLQSISTLSAIEAEYMALTETAKATI